MEYRKRNNELLKTDYIKRVKLSTSNMEFPITKKRLQNISEEYVSLKKKEIVDKFVNTITETILEKAYRAHSILDVAEPPNYRRQHILRVKDIDISDCPVDFSMSDCFIKIVAETKKRFPDMIICQDPLNTYILFDWN